MTDTNTPAEAVVDETPPDTEAAPQPNVVRVHGKEFDVNDPVQKAQLSAWDEAHAKFAGRQSNELGKLRKFYEDRKPTANEAELLAKAKAKAAEGDFDSAFDMVFSSAKAEVSAVREELVKTKTNSSLWEEYFSERPELAKRFGRDKVKQISETALNLYDESRDAFDTLDAYWKPMYETPSGQVGNTPKHANTDKAPVTVTGAATQRSQGGKAAPAKSAASSSKPSALDALFAHTVGAQKS